MLSEIKQELGEYNKAYKSGIMMSMRESIDAEYYCNMFLKKLDEIDKLNISEEDKIGMLQVYAQNVYDTANENGYIPYKYNLDDMLKVINQDSAKKR